MNLSNNLKIILLAAGLLLAAPLTSAGHVKAAKYNKKDIYCLAKNVYMEARGESFRGQVAVAQVVVNRLKHGSFGTSICGVVYAKNQFSWTVEAAPVNHSSAAWQQSLKVAYGVLLGNLAKPTFKALYFHNHTVNPQWSKRKRKTYVIGNHIFYA